MSNLVASIKIKADTSEAKRDIKSLKSDLSSLEKGVTVRINLDGVAQATRQLEQVQSTAERIGNVMSTIGSVGQGVGSAMQSIGNMFGGSMISTAKKVITAYGTRGVAGALQGTIERYDTMRLFPKRMAHVFGDSAETAEAATKAINDMEQAVLGLPTGLDEIVSSANQLIPLVGDIEKGSRLAIATNNAMIAGGADALQQKFGQRQIRDLLAAESLRSTEWDSLFKSLGAGLGVIAEEMGYSGKAGKKIKESVEQYDTLKKTLKSLEAKKLKYDVLGGDPKKIAKNASDIEKVRAALTALEGDQDKSLGTFRQDLKEGRIEAQDFIDALISAGSVDPQTGKVGKLVEWSDDMKDTISAATQNINNSFKRLGEGALKTLDAILLEGTGKDTVATIKSISDSVKENLVPALQGWMFDHKGEIIDFFNRIYNYDWKGLIGKVGDGIAKYYDLVSRFFTMFSPDWIARMAVWFGPVGKVVSGISGVVGKLGDVIAGIAIWKTSKKIATATEAVEDVAKIGFNFTNAFKGLAFGAGVVAVIGELALVVKEWAKVVSAINDIDLQPGFGKKLAVVSGMFASGGALTGLLTFFGGKLTSNPVTGGLAFGGLLLTSGFFLVVKQLGNLLQQYAEIINYVATMKTPSKAQWQAVGESVMNLGEHLLKKVTWDSSTGGTAKSKLKQASQALEYVVDIAESMKKIKDLGNIGNMTTKVNRVLSATKPLLENEALKDGSLVNAKDNKKKLKQISESAEYVSDIADSLVGMKDNLDALIHRGDATVLNNMVSGMDNMLGKLKTMLQHVNGYNRTGLFKTAKKNTAHVRDAVSNISEIVSGIVSAQDNLNLLVSEAERKDNQIIETDQIDLVMSGMKGVIEQFGLWSSDYKNAAKNLGSVSDAISNVKDIVQSITDMRDQIFALIPEDVGMRMVKGSQTVFDKLKDNLTTMLDGIAEMVEEIYDPNRSARLKKSLGDTSVLDLSMEHIKKTVGYFATMQTTLTNMGADGKFGVKEGGAVSFSLISDRIQTMLQQIDPIIQMFDGQGEFFKNIGSADDLTEKTGSISAALGGISNIATTLSEIQPQIDALGINGDAENWSLGKNLIVMMQSLNVAFAGLADADYGTLEESGGALETAVGNVKNIVDELTKMTDTVNGLVGNDMTFTVGDKLYAIFNSLNNAFGLVGPTLNGSGGAGSLGSIAPQLEAIATQLEAIGSSGEAAATQLEAAGGGMDTLGTAASNHKEAIENVAKAIKKLKTAVTGIGGQAANAGAGIEILGEKAAAEAGNIQNAATAAANLAAAISSIPSSKTVSLNVAGNATSTISSGAKGFFKNAISTIFNSIPKPFAYGGEVRGPGGIDNVPARLTNGEFVMTKRAHSAFGSSFMNRINNLDVEGAMRALSLRAGSGILSRAKVTNNYTRDNHANVTFNVNRATQGYSQRRASRWARALS